MLAVGGAVTSVWAHDFCTEDGGKGKHSPGHPHCDADTGTTTDGSLYKVSVSGALILGEHIGHDGVGNKETVSVNWDYLNMNLGFLERNVDNGDGFKCFGDPVPLAGRQTVLFIGHDKTGELEAGYVFSGYGTDGATRIGYRLKLSTEYDDPGWRPTSSEYPRTDLVFNKWELYHNKKSDIACIGSGFFLEVVGEEDTTISIILQ
jgi:hypothetical protein